MGRKHLHLIILASIALFMGLGCQGNPVSPDSISDNPTQALVSLQPQVHHSLGYFTLIADTQNLTIDVEPSRAADWHFNLTGILNTTMGVSAVGVPAEHDPLHGLFVFDVTLTHPFATKPQLSGFDVKGILMTHGTLAVGSLVFADSDETRLENADGYTRWWNPTEFAQPGMFGYTQGNLSGTLPTLLTATVNPYKLFADVLEPNDSLAFVASEPLDNPEGRAVFTAGSANTRRYRIRFPMDPGPIVRYGYAIDASWAVPSPNPPAEIPDDFPINANQPEAWRVSMSPSVNTLYYDTESGIGGGLLRMEINVHDWQGQYVGNTLPEIDFVYLYSPDLFSEYISADFLSSQTTKVKYWEDLTGDALPKQAGQAVLICRVGSTDGSSYQQTGAPAPAVPLSAFQVITLDIPDPDCAGDANNDWSEAEVVGLDSKVTGQICLPDDYRDFFRFTVPSGVALSGTISIHCDAEPTTIGLYNSGHELIEEQAVSAGDAALNAGILPLYPGEYFIRLYTSNSIQVAPYYLDMNIVTTDVTPTSPVEVTPDDLFCNPNFVWRYLNDLVLFGTYGLWIYDSTDNSNPELITAMPFWGSWTAAFSYPMIYYIHHDNDEDYLCAVDITDINHPAVYENIINYGEHISALTMNSEHLFVAKEENAADDLIIYDWTADHSNPVELDTANIDPCTGMALVDPEGTDTSLVTWSAKILATYAAEDPGTVTFEWPVFLSHDIRDVAIDGNRIMCACRDTGGSSIVSVYKLDDGPEFRDELDLPVSPISIDVEGNYAFIGSADGLTMVDISDIADLLLEDTLASPGYKLDILADGSDLFLVNYYAGFDVFNISYPTSPAPVYHSLVVNSPYEGVVDGDYMYILDTDWNIYNSLKAVDISNPSLTHVVDEMLFSLPPMDIGLGDGFLTILIGFQDLLVVDISNPLDLTVIESIGFGSSITDPAVYEDTLYLSGSAGALHIYDVSNPDSPVYEDTKTLANTLTSKTFAGDYMYGVTNVDTVEAYSISNPYNPVFAEFYSVENPYEMAAVADFLYINTEDVFHIADISDPADPVYAGSINMPGTSPYYRNIATDGYFAYFCGNKYSGPDPAICSGWPPESPSIVYTFTDWPYMTCYDVQVGNGYQYLFSTFGVRIFDLY